MQTSETTTTVLSRVPFDPADYVSAGFALVPIPRGMKGPRTPGWQLEESAIRTPEDASILLGCNIGLAHRWSGTCVLDIDDLQASTDWLAEWGLDLVTLLAADDAVQIRSGREGRAKLLYRLPEAYDWLPTQKIDAVGLEFRCANRDGTSTVQDVLPPSIHPDTNRPYEWAGAGDWRQLPTLPEELLEVWTTLATPAATGAEADVASQTASAGLPAAGGIPEGSRNSTLASLAGAMRHRGVGQGAIEAALLAHNAASCQPPLPEDEVRSIAKSIAKYPAALPNTRQAKTAQPGDEWPEPQVLDRECGVCEPYPLDALPGLIGAAVQEYQAFGQQPVGLVASSALSVVSLVTQGLANVERDRNLRGPLSLNFMVVAQSGERKTAADRAMGAPLADWEQLRAELMAADIAKNKAAIGAHEAKVEGLKAAIKSSMRKHADDVDALEARLATLEMARPQELVAPRLRYEDVNPQSLASALAIGYPSAALWSDEGGMVTGSHGMGRESFLGFMALLNRLWDGGSIRHDRKQAASLHVDGRRLTVSLMLQPAVLGELLQRGGGLSRGSGFLARFLVAAPASTMGTRFYRQPATGLSRMQQFHERVRYFLDQPLPTDESGRLQPPAVVLCPEAFAIWRTYHDDVERELRPHGDFTTVCDFAAKSAENAVRIAGCLHVFLEEGGVVQAETMERAVLLAHWYLRESLRLMDALDEPQPWTDARVLDTWLALRGECPMRDVLREGPGQLRDKARRNAAIAVLEELGRARRETHGTREMLVRNPQLP